MQVVYLPTCIPLALYLCDNWNSPLLMSKPLHRLGGQKRLQIDHQPIEIRISVLLYAPILLKEQYE